MRQHGQKHQNTKSKAEHRTNVSAVCGGEHIPLILESAQDGCLQVYLIQSSRPAMEIAWPRGHMEGFSRQKFYSILIVCLPISTSFISFCAGALISGGKEKPCSSEIKDKDRITVFGDHWVVVNTKLVFSYFHISVLFHSDVSHDVSKVIHGNKYTCIHIHPHTQMKQKQSNNTFLLLAMLFFAIFSSLFLLLKQLLCKPLNELHNVAIARKPQFYRIGRTLQGRFPKAHESDKHVSLHLYSQPSTCVAHHIRKFKFL